MTCDILGPAALDYLPCRYGTSKLQFRGPKRRLDGPYVAFLGGTLTYGRFIAQPYPLLVEHALGIPSVNLGQPNAGIDLLARDPEILKTAHDARATVIEVPGAANQSNRFFRVHPRRNDRVIEAGPALKRLYPEVDFMQFSFTQHLLEHLYRRDPERFEPMCKELQRTWVRRMGRILKRIEGPVVLLWLAETAPPERWSMKAGLAPRFVTRAMLDALAEIYAVRIHVRMPPPAEGACGKLFGALEERAAARLPEPAAHAHVSRALFPVLDTLI